MLSRSFVWMRIIFMMPLEVDLNLGLSGHRLPIEYLPDGDFPIKLTGMAIRFGRSSGTADSGGAGFREGPSKKKGRVFGFLFGLPFFAAGLLFCWIGALQPIVKVVSSGAWPQVPCVISRSEVESHSSSDGTTYSVEIEFRYQYDGLSYEGGSYHFSKMSSSGSEGKRQVTRQYPVGSEHRCWVNPADPTEAVLSRDLPGIVYFIIPFTSVFMIVGLAISLGSLGLLPQKWTDKVHSRHKPVEDRDEGERWLKPGLSGKGKLMASMFIAVFWNGITGVFVGIVIKGFFKGDPEWFLTFFMIPFVVIGLFLIGSVFYFLIALFNPRIELHLSEARPRLGQSVRLAWRSSGSLRRLEQLEILLEGREAATYRRGTDSVTDHSTFYRKRLFMTEQLEAHSSGELDLEIPAGSMHSFDGGNNKIEWRLRVYGAIRRWPDIDEAYPITIRPLK